MKIKNPNYVAIHQMRGVGYYLVQERFEALAFDQSKRSIRLSGVEPSRPELL